MGKASRRKWEARLEKIRLQFQQKTEVMHPFKWLGAKGIAAILLGGGTAVMFVFFWVGLALIYLGAIVLIVDFYYESWKWKWLKFVAMALPVILIIFPVSFWAFGSSPLRIQVHRHYGNYKEGEIVGGITWNSKYSELRVSFTNESDDDYEGLDALISTDLGTAATGWIGEAPTCVKRAKFHFLNARTKAKDKEGKILQETMMPTLATTGPYHLHCDKLIRHDSIQMVFALVNLPEDKNDTGKSGAIIGPESLLGPKLLPAWSLVEGTYKSMFRPFSFSERNQLKGD